MIPAESLPVMIRPIMRDRCPARHGRGSGGLRVFCASIVGKTGWAEPSGMAKALKRYNMIRPLGLAAVLGWRPALSPESPVPESLDAESPVSESFDAGFPLALVLHEIPNGFAHA